MLIGRKRSDIESHLGGEKRGGKRCFVSIVVQMSKAIVVDDPPLQGGFSCSRSGHEVPRISDSTTDDLLRRRMASSRSKSLMVPQTFETVTNILPEAGSDAECQKQPFSDIEILSTSSILSNRIPSKSANRRSMGYRPRLDRHPSEGSRGK